MGLDVVRLLDHLRIAASQHHLDRDLRQLLIVDRRRLVGGKQIDVWQAIPPGELFRLDNLGRFVLEPTPGVGVPLERRVVAVALADQVGAVLVPRPV